MNKAKTTKRRAKPVKHVKLSKHGKKSRASKASSQQIMMRNVLVGLLGVGIMLMLLSRFSLDGGEASLSDSYVVALPPVDESIINTETGQVLADAIAQHAPSTALTRTSPLLEENTIAQQPSNPNAKWHERVLKQGDNLTTLFNRHHIGHFTLKQVTQLPHAKHLTQLLKPGNNLRMLIDDHGQLLKLMYEINKDATLIIEKSAGTFHSHIKHRDFNEEVTLSQGEVGRNLKHTLRNAKISEKQWLDFAKIFSSVVDFRRDLHVGDKFEILYKKYRFNDNSIRRGDIVAAKLTTRKKTYTAIYFEPKDGKKGYYYTPDGESLHQSFIRSPLQYKRVSSKFDLNRLHPILNVKRPHEGVDLAAPRGTPIKAVGDARVKRVGPRGGYGKVVELDHGNGITTLYAHMSRFAKNMKQGGYVKKGQVIGYVGSTGLATGPHCHYEYRINGKPKNPMTVSLPKGRKVPDYAKARFNEQSKVVLAQFDTLQSTTVIAQR